ncbi:MAG: amino acid-binding protein [Candidatus Altiarchaeales archaeon]|mgnify:CR=1 FL=1|nr:MAG: amino acid-binding protein [Candidatus Altiarchaeales archaeon]
MIKQISIFLENEPGRLVKVAKILGNANINIRALTVAETSDFGILRLIVDDPERAYSILKENNIVVVMDDVLGVEVVDKPGGLARIAEILSNQNINIEYVYAFVTNSHEKAFIVLRVDEEERAINVLKENDVRILTSEDVTEI